MSDEIETWLVEVEATPPNQVANITISQLEELVREWVRDELRRAGAGTTPNNDMEGQT